MKDLPPPDPSPPETRATHQQKAALRAALRQRRVDLGPIERRAKSDLIAERLHLQFKLRGIRTFAVYHPTPTEVDLQPYFNIWLEDGQTVLLPRVVSQGHMVMAPLLPDKADLVKNRHGIYEPQTPPWCGPIEAVVVPGLAFDREHRRLGNGGGYYDGFLAEHPKVFAIGIFYACQEVPAIPVEAHDRRLDMVLTEEGVR